jgi:hypothetical protein
VSSGPRCLARVGIPDYAGVMGGIGDGRPLPPASAAPQTCEDHMTNLLARILLAIMLLPLAATVYLVVVFSMISRRGSDEPAFLVATLVTIAFVVVYWLRLWRESVSWTSTRVGRTVLAAAGCLGAGIICAAFLNSVSNIRELSFCYFIAGLISIVSWLPLTVLIWRETAEERAERLRHAAGDVLYCPRCGYNMTGLHEARCPECGAQYTLNQLYAAQQKHEIADAAVPTEERSLP